MIHEEFSRNVLKILFSKGNNTTKYSIYSLSTRCKVILKAKKEFDRDGDVTRCVR